MNRAVAENRRVLVVDDNCAIHEDFRKILVGRNANPELAAAREGLFDDVGPVHSPAPFEVDCADQGQTAVRIVELAVAANKPYALAFVDMRMPPGWDGAETIERLWKIDPNLQCVICTAYTDHPWDEV